MEKAMKNRLYTIYHSQGKTSSSLAESNRKKNLETFKKLLELRKKMLKKVGKSVGGHSEVHSFFEFVPSESYECLQSKDKALFWLLFVLGFIASLPFNLFFLSIIFSFICSPLIMIVLCCCKDRNLLRDIQNFQPIN